ncbi:hypothetical protein HDU76_009370, partial [Blyttiomyces sp. JEL0837]
MMTPGTAGAGLVGYGGVPPVISSIERDLEEWDRRDVKSISAAAAAEDRERVAAHAAGAGDSGGEEDDLVGLMAGGDHDASLHANLKRARTTTPTANDEQKQLLAKQQQQQQQSDDAGSLVGGERATSLSLSRYHDQQQRLATAGLSIDTSCISAAPSLSSESVIGGASVIAASQHGSSPPTPLDGPQRPPSCVAYQKGECVVTQKECKGLHVCIRCGGNHPVILCKKDRNVCVKWNMEAWNSAGTCRIVDCRRLHECIRCGASHPSIICPENLDNYLAEYIKRRRAEGYKDEELMRLEIQLAHSLPTTITPSTSAVAAASSSSLSSSGMYSSSGVYSGSNSGLNTPMATPGMMQMNLNNTASSGMNMNQLGNLNQMGLSNGIGMGMGTHHPMHIAAAAAAAAAMRAANMTQQQQHQQQQQQQQQQQVLGNPQGSMTPTMQPSALSMHHYANMLAMDPERANKRLRAEDPAAAALMMAGMGYGVNVNGIGGMGMGMGIGMDARTAAAANAAAGYGGNGLLVRDYGGVEY